MYRKITKIATITRASVKKLGICFIFVDFTINLYYKIVLLYSITFLFIFVKQMLRIAIDLCGGDNAPNAVLDGIELFVKSDNQLRFTLFGLAEHKKLINSSIESFCDFVECAEKVLPDTKPSYAVKYMRKSTMAQAILATQEGVADATLCAGNTGALMALSNILIKQTEGVDRPPLCTVMPTRKNITAMLDLGAVVECKPENLLQFAIMGSAFISAVYPEIESPSIGLLNVGIEEGKGSALIKDTHELIQNSHLKGQYVGFVEGDDIANGAVNVVVTDGFTGNVALKTYEGSARVTKAFLTEAFSSSICAKIGYLLAKKSLYKTLHRINPNNYNGALLLGLERVVVKSHGSANAEGFANAIKVTKNLVENNIVNKIKQSLNKVKYGSSNEIL
jgi:glycerol-3-phosphate acyltransferase PlsX